LDERSKKALSRANLRNHKGIPYCDMQLRRMIASGEFPAPFYLSERKPVWWEHEVDAWLLGKAEATRRVA